MPEFYIRDVDMRAGSHIWFDSRFIVRDLDNLAFLGIADAPFMVAGVDLLADRTFYLDPRAGELRLPRNVWIGDPTQTGRSVASPFRRRPHSHADSPAVRASPGP